MTARLPLVTYDRPPLIEVVIGVQFERLAKLDAARLGLLWQRFRSRFPNTEQKPALDPSIERLGLRGPVGETRFELLTELRQRLWFVNEARTSWSRCRMTGSSATGAAARNRRNHTRDLRNFCRDSSTTSTNSSAFSLTSRSVRWTANQCEVTYVNLIRSNAHWSSHGDLAKVFRGWSAEYGPRIEWPTESIRLNVAHLLNDDAGEFVGRLHVALEPAFAAPQGSPAAPVGVYRLTLTARGRPMGEGREGINVFLELGHRAVVTSFDRMVDGRHATRVGEGIMFGDNAALRDSWGYGADVSAFPPLMAQAHGYATTVPSSYFLSSLPQASWLRDAMRKLAELASLPPNWDSYGGRPLSPEMRLAAGTTDCADCRAWSPDAGDRADVRRFHPAGVA